MSCLQSTEDAAETLSPWVLQMRETLEGHEKELQAERLQDPCPCQVVVVCANTWLTAL